MKHPRGILSLFMAMAVALVLIAVLVTGTMIYGQNVQQRLQAAFIDRTALSDAVLADLYDMEQLFDEFGRERTEEKHQAYKEACAVFAADLAALQSSCEDELVTLNYIRRLNNFNLYQQQQIESGLETSAGWFNVYSYVRDGIRAHQQQAVRMAQHDMTAARSSYEAASERATRQMSVLAAVFAGAILLIGALLTRFSVAIRRAFASMTDYFDHLARRDWSVHDLEITSYRELALIAQTANHMKQELNSYICQIEEKARLEKQLDEERLINEQQRTMMVAAQLSALRAQVNPHFLFNSLNLIGVTSLVGDPALVMQMVEATGQILRYSLYHQETMTTLDEELAIVQKYLFLQKCRFSDAVSIEISNELEGEDICIPTMSVQAVVENCFKHGFGTKEALHIRISARWENGCAWIRILDDGVGFDPQEIKAQSAAQPQGGVGLSNIRKRLELLYGTDRDHLEIESLPGTYSSVTLIIPQEVQDEDIDR